MQKEHFSIKKRIRSFGYAFNGLRVFFSREHNAWIHGTAAVVAIAGGAIIGLEPCEWIAVAIVIGMVFAAEIVNTAIEYLCDMICPDYHKTIGTIKDLAAAAVVVCAIVAVAVAAIIIANHYLL